jgi:hypothetical protein
VWAVWEESVVTIPVLPLERERERFTPLHTLPHHHIDFRFVVEFWDFVLKISESEGCHYFTIKIIYNIDKMANQGFGCMGFSVFYGKKSSPEQAKSVIHHATESGVTLFNSATFYGELNEVGFGANVRLLKSCIEGLDRSKIQLMVKVGMDTRYFYLQCIAEI